MKLNACITITVLLVGMIAIGCGGSTGKNSDVRVLVENERAFAEAAAERGVRSAFLSFLSDDGVIFRPGPVNGREWYLAQKETGAYLGWEPTFGDISRDGALGFTTGPWAYNGRGNADSTDVFGQYVSVWKIDSTGEWRVAVDIGTVHPPPMSNDISFATVEDRVGGRWVGGKSSDRGGHLELLKTAEARFAAVLRESGAEAAYARFASEDIRFLRMDVYPIVGLGAVRRFLADTNTPGETTSGGSIRGGDAASSGDLGYVYGVMEQTSFLRIWSRLGDGTWTIALDVAIPGE
jgi:ketosteroid isomerase-like protein